MKNVITIASASLACFIITGCSSTNALKNSAPIPVVSETVVATPKVVAGEKIQGKSKITNILFGLIILGDTKYADTIFGSGVKDDVKSGVLSDFKTNKK